MLKIKLFLILIIITSSTELCAQSSIQDDLKNFISGEKLKFTTADHSKSRGLNIQIDIPKNWKMKEGERPHIVQKFSSAGAKGIVKVATIHISSLPSELKGFSDKEITEVFFDPDFSEEILPEKSKLIIAKPTEYDGEPGIFVYYLTQTSRAGLDFSGIVVSHRFFYQKAMVDISITYSVLISPTQEKISQQQCETFLKLAIQIGNSIVLPDKYKFNKSKTDVKP